MRCVALVKVIRVGRLTLISDTAKIKMWLPVSLIAQAYSAKKINDKATAIGRES